MSGVRLTGLHIYPLKSARGTSLTEAAALSRGLRCDRRWMLVDQDGEFLTQRSEPKLATLGAAAAADGGLILSADGRDDLAVPPPAPDATRMPTVIWDDTVPAQLAGAEANIWLGEWLGRPAWLAWMPDDAPRPAKRAPEVDVSFADGYPYLLCSEDSLRDLAASTGAGVPMDRFRPNLVIAGAAPWAEESWRRLRIGGVEFECVKPCARCVVTTTDQASGERLGPEPLRGLAAHRRREDGKVNFGMNLVASSTGRILLGDGVEPLS